jgi:ribosomal peptide maturation radical SAM protein 1
MEVTTSRVQDVAFDARRDSRRGLKTALVYPPFGPSGLPSLGLALLSAGLKERGLKCRTFYWNLDLVSQMPGSNLKQQLGAYRSLSDRTWHPFNEWIFARVVHGTSLDYRESETQHQLRELSRSMPDDPITSEHILKLRARANQLVSVMLRKLAPYHLVGISTTFFQNLPALALARRIKERWPEKIIVLGGANCDGEMGQALLTHFGFLDYVFTGEVDTAFPEFVERLSREKSVTDIPGLFQRTDNDEIVAGPPALPLEDLDSLAYPDFDDFMNELRRTRIDQVQKTTLALESSRGCWWGARQHCTFCGLNANGMGYRQKSEKRFQREVKDLIRRYEAEFVFMTDNILSMSYYDRFMDWARLADLKVNFFYEIKANLKRKHVERLADAGINAVQPGIESFSSNVLALMRKGTTGIQNIAFLKYASEYGVFPTYNLLVGFPGEDPNDYRRMSGELQKLVHLPPPTSLPELEFHRFSPYHKDPSYFGIRLRPSPRYFHLYPFSEESLSQLAYMFERDDVATMDRSYIDELYQRVVRWHKNYRIDLSTLSWWREGSDILVSDCRPGFPKMRYRLRDFAPTVFQILDSPGTLRSLVREAEDRLCPDNCGDFLSLVLHLSPIKRRSKDEMTISFSAQEFAMAPAECLEPLVEAGLLYVEESLSTDKKAQLRGTPTPVKPEAGHAQEQSERLSYLALPVSKERRPMIIRWQETGV